MTAGYVLTVQVGNPTRKLVLVGLAEKADPDGTDAWPSVQTLASYAECDTRTVRRHLAALLAEGHIREGDQSHWRGPDPRHRTIVYDVAMNEADRMSWAALAGESGGARERYASVRADNMSALNPELRADIQAPLGRTTEPVRADTAMPANPPSNPPTTHPSVETLVGGSQFRSGPVELPHPRCPQHHDRPATSGCGPCADARRLREEAERAAVAERSAQQSTTARQRAEAERQAIDACSRCDPSGRVGMALCRHDPAAPARAERGAALVRAALAKT